MKDRRDATWWIRFPDLNWPNEDNAEKIKRRAEALADGNVSTVIVFGTHFRWDYLPYFEILHDYLAAVAEACHERGMELFDHHSVNLVHRYSGREEMQRTILHSGPHLPFSPSYEAAKDWRYEGMLLNDWRMIDVETGKPLFFPQYQAEGFCHRNPEFIRAYQHYVQKLIRDTGIDGLLSDDAMYFMHFRACACPACRAEFKKRTGMELPPVTDTSFWGNYDNPAWKAWIDLRYDASGEFMEAVRKVLPKDFPLGYCGYHSDRGLCNSNASDARQFTRGANYLSVEISGNIPPYLNDPKTVNHSVGDHIVSGSMHQAVARERGIRCYENGYGFVKKSAEVLYGVSRLSGADMWFSTLKARLGLPDHILETLPDEGEIVKDCFAFEKAYPELAAGDTLAKVAIFFSYETRNHSLFGNKTTGYQADYGAAVKYFFRRGIGTHTVFSVPIDASVYPLLVVPSALLMTEDEKTALEQYRKNGGTVLLSGPSAVPETKSVWPFPNRLDLPPMEFLPRVKDGEFVRLSQGAWVTEPYPSSNAVSEWKEILPGLLYDPVRISEDPKVDAYAEFAEPFLSGLPVRILSAEGYFSALFETEHSYVLHFLAAEYETDIDHHLDEIRTHRSRVNYVNKIEPAGVGKSVRVAAVSSPEVFTPFNEGKAETVFRDGEAVVTLPEQCAYFALRFDK